MRKQKGKESPPNVGGLMNLSRDVRSAAAVLQRGNIQDSYSGFRELERELNLPETISCETYFRLWKRNGLSRRIISLYPDESWKTYPQIIESEDANESKWEANLKKYFVRYNLWSIMEKLDVVSGIGSYGIALLILNDGKKLSEPVIDEKDSLFGNIPEGITLQSVRVFQEYEVMISEYDTDITSKRYGLPLYYLISFGKPKMDVGNTQNPEPARAFTVHWQRVIHVADNTDSSLLFGSPRLEAVFNDVFNLTKVIGSSSDMYYKGAFPGISLEMDAKIAETGAQIDKESVRREMDEYQSGLRRYIALQGLTANSLAPQVVSPDKHFDVLCKLISSAIGCPIRIFMGAEQAQLASQDDVKTWLNRVRKRRDNHVSVNIIRPLVDRLIAFGCIPMPKEGAEEDGKPIYYINWVSTDDTTEQVRARIGMDYTQAICQYASTPGADQVITPEDFFNHILNLPQDVITAIMKNAQARIDEGITIPRPLGLEDEDGADKTEDGVQVTDDNGKPLKKLKSPLNDGRKGNNGNKRTMENIPE